LYGKKERMIGMENVKREMVRVNTRISEQANNWLDSESNKTGIPKSTLILLAIENYIREKEVIQGMNDMSDLYAKMQQLEEAVKRKDQ
jgi:predicted DNA-binding protein